VFHYLAAPVRWAERELSPVKKVSDNSKHLAPRAANLTQLPETPQA
jgi:hypothetical protein